MTKREGTEMLRKDFSKETGMYVFNIRGEVDMDYVFWLENKIINNNLHERKK